MFVGFRYFIYLHCHALETDNILYFKFSNHSAVVEISILKENALLIFPLMAGMETGLKLLDASTTAPPSLFRSQN